MRYVIITPAKNEAALIGYVLESVSLQSRQPVEWIIVDDGSIDDTVRVAAGYAERFPWIRVVPRPMASEARRGGANVVGAFYDGLRALRTNDYEVIVKLDADLTIPRYYFKEVLNCFGQDPQVGLCGGYLVEESGVIGRRERTAGYHVRGALKAYRRSCFEKIGGLQPVHLWDSVDEFTAMQMGWSVRVLPIAVVHHRQTSAATNRGLSGLHYEGRAYYRIGHTVPLCLGRGLLVGLRRSPLLVSGLAFAAGSVLARLRREQLVVSEDLARFIRLYQYGRLRRRILGRAASPTT